MIKCLIVDDEQYAIDTLTQYINQTDDCSVLGTFTSPYAALRALEAGLLPDILFLDVDMPELSGMELAALIPPQIAIIYVTAHGDYALKAFETNVFDFLLKPVSYPKFLKSIQKIKRVADLPVAKEIAHHADYIFINPGIKGKVIKLYFSDILYVEGLKNYVVFNQQKEKFITYLTMKEIEEALPTPQFVRIHKSYIINFSKVIGAEGNMVILQNNLKLQVGGNYKERLRKLIIDNSITSIRAANGAQQLDAKEKLY
jgi:two-component system LytT family response regulator